MPSFSSSWQSRSNCRGYFDKSSVGPNCVGFTKMETATASHCAFAARTSDKCPSCRAPIVGTKPSRLRVARASRQAARASEMVAHISIVQSIDRLADRPPVKPKFGQTKVQVTQGSYQGIALAMPNVARFEPPLGAAHAGIAAASSPLKAPRGLAHPIL